VLKSGVFIVTRRVQMFVIFHDKKGKFLNFSPQINVKQFGQLIKPGLDTSIVAKR
jgi:hypothetical protein